jgi:hypothetical protein
MTKRTFRIVKRENNVPVLGVCERCKAQFTARPESLAQAKDAHADIQTQFIAHTCKRLGNALRVALGIIDLHNQDSSGVSMTSQVVNLQVTASLPIDCDFWSEDDGWKGLCKSLSVTVHGSSFEDAKKNMATELQAHVEKILREHPTRSARRIALTQTA